MARKKKHEPKAGDVFAIPVKEGHYCFGQVVSDRPSATYEKLYILFDVFLEGVDHDITGLIRQPVLAIAHLDDESIKDGDWVILGNTDVALPSIKYPEYLTGPENIGGPEQVIDYEGEVIRDATPQDLDELTYPESYSSHAFDGIAQARFAGGPWEEEYEELRFDPQKWIGTGGVAAPNVPDTQASTQSAESSDDRAGIGIVEQEQDSKRE
ncbi:Imm26 family immunity protein [Brevibacillus dissolubilis]|uniref:Imm26 family immunity protein n=1 Tax=Brevibacillus dissolubilis TaxID=1844116 RepID=UPI00159BE180|nr:Imm26 family immunity protein [Brevibacillus dissolubilis]